MSRTPAWCAMGRYMEFLLRESTALREAFALPLGIAALLAYLIGSIPFGVFIARRVAGIDIRVVGSGNIGATNVGRMVGKKFGILTLFLDALKGFVPIIIFRFWVMPETPTIVEEAVVGFCRVYGPLFFVSGSDFGAAKVLPPDSAFCWHTDHF